MAIETQKEPGKQAPQPDVQPGRTPREIPQNKDIPEKETPPMQLAPGRGGNWWCEWSERNAMLQPVGRRHAREEQC